MLEESDANYPRKVALSTSIKYGRQIKWAGEVKRARMELQSFKTRKPVVTMSISESWMPDNARVLTPGR
jgi:hypothetical protein